jgi:glycosyltransferase involved in cell wall biosynthesis
MVDVCLVVEGTWPLWTGGVSTWVQELLQGLPELSFSVVHVGPRPDAADPVPFISPVNVRRVDYLDLENYTDIAALSEYDLPDARVYHALSSGIPAVLALAAAKRRKAPVILSEHGIAWREAAIGARHYRGLPSTDLAYRSQWADVLKRCAQEAYRKADVITSVNRAARNVQISAGAPPGRCRIVSNGTRIPTTVRSRDARSSIPTVGLIARVVPIKDVITFVSAAKLVAREAPDTAFIIAGPTSHDRPYARLCEEYAGRLELGGQLRFVGEVDVPSLLPELDIVALTSISEGSPLALLEAMAAGVPVVSTRVGGCEELVSGVRPSGLLTAARSPKQTANAILRLIHDSTLRERFARNGHTTVTQRYSLAACLTQYRQLYADLL